MDFVVGDRVRFRSSGHQGGWSYGLIVDETEAGGGWEIEEDVPFKHEDGRLSRRASVPKRLVFPEGAVDD